MAQDNAGVENSNKLIWWLFSIGSGLLLLLISVLMSKLDRIDTRLNALEASVSSQTERMRGIDLLLTETRREQVERTFRFGDMGNKINALEQAQKYLDSRYQGISERILAINTRLDKAPNPVPD